MLDQFGREISYMRISLTDRCNLRCAYCRPNGFASVQHADVLRYEEVLRVCQQAVKLGITRFKVTGGEPLVRKGCLEFLQALKGLPGVEQVTLTSNGTMLAECAKSLAAIGIDGVNVSLDTCARETFERITGVDALPQVLAGIEKAVATGIKVKLNCVPLKVIGEAGVLDLVRYAESIGVPVRFIELMPLACNGGLEAFTGEEVRKILENLCNLKATFSFDTKRKVAEKEKCALFTLKGTGKSAGNNAFWPNGPRKLSKEGQIVNGVTNTYRLGNGPAVYYDIDGYSVPIGFIEPLHGKFCASCNRVRLTSVGKLKLCLYSGAGLDVRELLRSGVSDEELLEVMQQALYAKPKEHGFDSKAADFSMNEIGG